MACSNVACFCLFPYFSHSTFHVPKGQMDQTPIWVCSHSESFSSKLSKKKSNGSDQLGFHFLFRYYNLITDCTHSCRNQKSDIKREEEEEVTKKLVGFCYGFQNFGVKDRALTATVQRQPIP
ncbi:unnamed protein product [Prunus brigantina]